MMLRRTRRVLATVLFTDIVRSTELAAELGDRRWRTVLAAHHRLVRAALRQHRGREIDNAGDGFFATFQEPTEAVRCAASIAAAVHSLGVDVRAAIHFGECEVIGSKVGGIAVHIASRVLSEAGPGEVMVTSTVHDLVTGSELEFEEIGLRGLKGVPGDWRLFRLQSTAMLEESALADSQAAARSRRLRVRQLGLLLAAAVALMASAVAVVLLLVVPPPGTAITPGPNTLVRLGEAGQAALVVGVPDGPEHLVYDGVQLWVGSANAGVVTRFSPIDGAELGSTGQLGRPTGMVAADGEVWVADRFAEELRRVEPNGLERFPVEVSAQTLAVGFGSLWASDDIGERVLRINSDTGNIVEEIGLPDGSPDGIVAGNDSTGTETIWVAASGPHMVLAIDPATNEFRGGSILLRSPPTKLALSGDWLWALAPTTDELYQIEASTGRLVEAHLVCNEPSSIAADVAGAWVACRQGRAIWRVNADGSESEPYSVNGVPTAITLVQGRLWTILRAD